MPAGPKSNSLLCSQPAAVLVTHQRCSGLLSSAMRCAVPAPLNSFIQSAATNCQPLGQDTYAGSGRSKNHPAASAQPAKPAPHPNPSMPHPDAALTWSDRCKQAKQPPARCRLCRLQQTQPSCLGTAPWPSGPTRTGELHQRHTRCGPPATLSQ